MQRVYVLSLHVVSDTLLLFFLICLSLCFLDLFCGDYGTDIVKVQKQFEIVKKLSYLYPRRILWTDLNFPCVKS